MIRSFHVDQKETLMHAIQRAGAALNAPCGGNHSCGKCRVRLLEGKIPEPCAEEMHLLSEEEIRQGWRLACAVMGAGDWTIEIPEQDSGARVMTEGAQADAALDPQSRVYCVEASKPSLSDQRADAERLPVQAEFSLKAMRKLPSVVREGEKVYLVRFAGGPVEDCSAKPIKNLGIAVDVGTTTLAAYLIDLSDGQELACASGMNPQRSFGGDVISRVDYAGESEENANRLQSVCVRAIEELGMQMLRRTGNVPSDVRHIVCVGNTIMMHLLAGLETVHIAKAPFTPVYARSWNVHAQELGMAFEQAYVTLAPCVAGYVGADTVAAALACGMDEADEVQLLIDIGTNGEIALGNREALLCCSAAAGPAFEGAHIRCGSGAQDGAVDHVTIENGKVKLSVLGGGIPRSICGSGLVDAVAAMLREGIMDETGRIDEDEMPEEYEDFLFEYEGNPAFSLDGRAEEGVFISQQDLREVQLAKAAIAAGVQVLMNEAQLEYDQVARLCLAGGFGNYIGRESAVEIGLLPEEMKDKIVPVGNAAGTGARQMLKNRTKSASAEALRGKMKYIELSARADFQNLFVENMMFGSEDW